MDEGFDPMTPSATIPLSLLWGTVRHSTLARVKDAFTLGCTHMSAFYVDVIELTKTAHFFVTRYKIMFIVMSIRFTLFCLCASNCIHFHNPMLLNNLKIC